MGESQGGRASRHMSGRKEEGKEARGVLGGCWEQGKGRREGGRERPRGGEAERVCARVRASDTETETQRSAQGAQTSAKHCGKGVGRGGAGAG
eukprot:1599552-Rhodomonas_salina.1